MANTVVPSLRSRTGPSLRCSRSDPSGVPGPWCPSLTTVFAKTEETPRKVNLNEIVYRLRELRDPLMLRILEQILMGYDSLISERLSQTGIYPSKARKGLGRHIRKGDGEGRYCRGRKVRKRGYRKQPRKISTIFGDLRLPIRTVGLRYSLLAWISSSFLVPETT